MKPDSKWFQAQFDRAGLSQRGAAKALKLDPSSLVHLMAGRRRMQVDEAYAIAALISRPISEVLERAGFRRLAVSKATPKPRPVQIGWVDADLRIHLKPGWRLSRERD